MFPPVLPPKLTGYEKRSSRVRYLAKWVLYAMRYLWETYAQQTDPSMVADKAPDEADYPAYGSEEFVTRDGSEEFVTRAGAEYPHGRAEGVGRGRGTGGRGRGTGGRGRRGHGGAGWACG